MQQRLPAALFFLALWFFIPGCTTIRLTQEQPTQGLPRITMELNSGWVCMKRASVKTPGEELSQSTSPLVNWLPATVPGTVLTTLLDNHLIADPLYGMNNAHIPDVHETGPEEYTYWFVKDFQEPPPTNDGQVWLRFRGVNYGCDVYLNGRRLNPETHYGMYLRQEYNITALLSHDGKNRLAVLVYPPNPVGDPNGGQGGDGTIGRAVANQYVAGWDWIPPIHDRNTGIWDKVTLETTNSIALRNPHVVTIVPGKRFPDRPQDPVNIRSSAEIVNPNDESIRGTLRCAIDGNTVSQETTLQPGSTTVVRLPDLSLPHPRLWWPNGYGSQDLYRVTFEFVGGDGRILDSQAVNIGIREIETAWNERTRSREVRVNGQRIFIRGGNWIASDAMLRFTPERYDAEVRFHRDMNLNLIRIWGGGLTERPEFYNACDKYGLLVFQDFWMSGDCNGKWFDPKKKDDQWTRRQYPDDHKLFLASIADQVKMLRNHPSLAFYCGGNEIPPPEDILTVMQDSLLPTLDGTRFFFTYSNEDSMSFNFIGGNGDGTYHLQPVEYFWEHQSFPFNSEIGSVGMGDSLSLARFIPPENMIIPDFSVRRLDSVWRYHKYLGYSNQIDAYGKPSTIAEFADKAQLVNYDQYRALVEGHLSHMWDWYTGVIIWKTQNPWTALRGQMYDYYLDPNAGLYGLHHAGTPVHVMCSPVDSMVYIVNNTFHPYHNLMVQGRAFDLAGRDSVVLQWLVEISPTSVQKIESVKRTLGTLFASQGGFLDLRLLTSPTDVLDENLYWYPDSTGEYSGLRHMETVDLHVSARNVENERIEVRLENPAHGPVAFFNRLSLVDAGTGNRILPVFYSDNYVSVMPGEEKAIIIESPHGIDKSACRVSVTGWNVKDMLVSIQ